VTDTPLVSVLLLGLLFGIQHATDADHVVAVATIVSRTRRFAAGALVGAFWGAGHTMTVTVVGAAILLADLTVTRPVAQSLELAVALMLIVLGGARIAWSFRGADPVALRHLGAPHAHAGGPGLHRHSHAHGETVHRHPHAHPPARLLRALQTVGLAQALRSTLVGLVHGLAGSAAIALLVLSTIRGTAAALGYLALFGVGTIVGMTAITGLLSLPFTIRAVRVRRAQRGLALTAGAISVAFGLYLAFQIGVVDGLFLDRLAARGR
jgi:hypothetical protein